MVIRAHRGVRTASRLKQASRCILPDGETSVPMPDCKKEL